MADKLYDFSDLDRQIVKILKENGRMSNPKIAEVLGVSNTMVGARIRQMEDAKAMKIVAVVDFAALGYNYLFTVGIDVKGRMAQEVADDIAVFDEVLVVQSVMGRHDLEILIAFSEMSELSDFLMSKLLQVKGIRNVESAYAVDISKFEFNVAPI